MLLGDEPPMGVVALQFLPTLSKVAPACPGLLPKPVFVRDTQGPRLRAVSK